MITLHWATLTLICLAFLVLGAVAMIPPLMSTHAD